MQTCSAKHSNCSLLISRGQNPKPGRKKITAHLSLYESWIKDRRTEKGTVCHEENKTTSSKESEKCQRTRYSWNMQKNVVQQKIWKAKLKHRTK